MSPTPEKPPTSSYSDEEAGTVIGPYKLLQRLGKGGMGVVWMAEQRSPVERYVALKIIKTELQGGQVVARFEAERQALAMMDHPNIAKVLDAGATESGRPYFVMELVKGVPCNEFCDHEKLPLKDRLELFIPVCNAVQHAHQKGIVHRDLKPSNVLIALYDGKAVPKVIDFGVAKATHQKLTEKTLFTEVGHIIGTLEYMAPEQAELNNLDIDTRADIYSLGVMLYEILTGSLPFSRKQLQTGGLGEILRVIREVEPPTPSAKLSSSERLPMVAAQRRLEPKSLAKLVRGDLDWIVMKCLDKERGRRYETANQLGEELNRFLCDEPVQAGPPSVGYRTRKFLRRNKGSVIAAGMVLAALVLGVVGTSFGLIAAERARNEEAAQRQQAEVNEKKALASAEQERVAKVAAEDAAAKEKRATERALRSAEAEKSATAMALAAAEKERLAGLLATQRLKQIEKANGLLESIFVDIDPRREAKGGPLLREQLAIRLRGVADKLDEEALGDPLVVARLQSFLGNALANLGDTDSAIRLHAKARAILEQSLGADHPDTLASMNNLAFAYQSAGQLTKALALHEETLAKRKAKLGLDHPDTLTSMNNLAARRTDLPANWPSAALPLLEETLDKMKAKLGPDHPDTLICMSNLALAYHDAGQLAKALPLFEKTFAKFKAKLGPDHPGRTPSARRN